MVLITVIMAVGISLAVVQGVSVVLLLPLLLVAALLAIVYWRVTLYVFLGYLVVGGFVSTLFYSVELIRIVPHVLAAVVYVGFLREAYLRGRSIGFRSPLVVVLCAVIGLWLAYIPNPGQINRAVAVLGLITYVYFLPFVLIGYHVLADSRAMRRFCIFMLATSVPVVAVGTLQYLLGQEAYAALFPGFKAFSVGSFGVDVFRFPATLAGPTQLALYLNAEVLIAAGGIWAFRGLGRWLAGVVLAACLFLIAINGSRGAYLIPPVSLSVLITLICLARPQLEPVEETNRSPAGRRSVQNYWVGKVAGAVVFLTVIGIGMTAALGLGGDVLAARLSTLSADRYYEDPEDFSVRVTKTWDLVGGLITNDPVWWLGHGTGTASPYLWQLGIDRPVDEALLAELLYQLGLLGWVAYLTLFVVILVEAYRATRRSSGPENWVWSRVSFVYVLQVVAATLLTGDEALVLFPSNVLFWLLLGGLLAQRRRVSTLSRVRMTVLAGKAANWRLASGMRPRLG